MTIEYLKCSVDFGVKQCHWYDCDQVGSYFVLMIDRFLAYIFLKYASYAIKGNLPKMAQLK